MVLPAIKALTDLSRSSRQYQAVVDVSLDKTQALRLKVFAEGGLPAEVLAVYAAIIFSNVLVLAFLGYHQTAEGVVRSQKLAHTISTALLFETFTDTA